jgi:RimJ/RimL family protein N-acetyltransferase
MNTQYFLGQQVRLVALNSDTDAGVMARWSADFESWRLLDGANWRARSQTGAAGEAPTRQPRRTTIGFVIRTLVEDRSIGYTGLLGIRRVPGEAWLRIGLGDRRYWDQRYGADALQVMLRYAFHELNLNRISLGVFDYDAGVIRAYEAAGFAIEGRMLQEAGRDGRSRAGVLMGIRREEWEQTVKRDR